MLSANSAEAPGVIRPTIACCVSPNSNHSLVLSISLQRAQDSREGICTFNWFGYFKKYCISATFKKYCISAAYCDYFPDRLPVSVPGSQSEGLIHLSYWEQAQADMSSHLCKSTFTMYFFLLSCTMCISVHCM